MRQRQVRAAAADSRKSPEDGVIIAIDAALGFLAGQRWVRSQDAVTLLESVRDVALELNALEHVHELIESARAGCDQHPIPAVQLRDELLDIRNAIRRSGIAMGGAR